MSGALLERVRLSAYLVLAVLLGSGVWILDAAWGWSFGGWLTLRFGFHDSIASAVVHGVSGAFTLGVLFNLGPRIGKYTKEGLTRTFRPHNIHMTLMGLMLIFTGFYAFYAACLVIVSTTMPGWANIYLSPTTLGSIAMIITFGFAGGFTGGYFASRGDPFWTVSGGLAGVISVSAGADVYAPTLGYLIAMGSAAHGRLGRELDRDEDARRRRRRRGGGARLRGLPGDHLGRDLRRRVSDRASTTSRARSGGQLMGLATFLPLGFLSGWFASWVLKKLNLLRVPPEVELDGLDHGRVRARHPRARVRPRRGPGDRARRQPGARGCGAGRGGEGADHGDGRQTHGQRRSELMAGDNRQRARLRQQGSGDRGGCGSRTPPTS